MCVFIVYIFRPLAHIGRLDPESQHVLTRKIAQPAQGRPSRYYALIVGPFTVHRAAICVVTHCGQMCVCVRALMTHWESVSFRF